MCNIWRKEQASELNLEQIESFFRKSNRFSWIGVTGGEPFLRQDLYDVVKIILTNCRELSVIHFATNGTLTNKILEVTENIIRYKSNNVRVLFTLSIDGPPHLHDEIRGIEGAWLKCIDTFKELRKIKHIQARIGITLSHFNFDKFPIIFKSLKVEYPLLRFDDITINVFHRSSFYYCNDNMMELDYQKFVSHIDAILRIDRERFTINNFLRRRYLKLYKNYTQNKKCPLRCQALSSSCVLDPQGDIYPCGIYEIKVANIIEEDYDLEKIWSYPHTKELSRKCSKGICPSCWSPCDAYSAIVGSLFRLNLWR